MCRVYQECKDGKRFFLFEHEDRFECEVYVDHHKYDRAYTTCGAKMLIEEDE
jgi:hypothetical protein